MEDRVTERQRQPRQLPQVPSKIPVRRDQSLPSSGRSTPCSSVRPAMKREASSPACFITTPAQSKPRPPIAPKPSQTKISARLSLPSAGRGRSLGNTSRSQVVTQYPASDVECSSGRSTPSSSLSRISKIPRPDKVLKKWDSTSRLEMQRRNSDLIEPVLRKRTLTHTSSVNLPRTMSESARALSSSNGNLVRSISGSITNLSRTSPLVRSCSSSSFSAVEVGARNGRQDPMVKSQMDINKDSKAKSSVKMNLGLGSKQKSPGSLQDQLERLQRELEDAHGLVYCLRAEIDQKEQIAKLALSGSKESTADFESLYKDLQKEHNKTLLMSRTMDEKTKKLESDLRDARDNAELLEFRLLELEQRESRERTPDMARKVEKVTSTTTDITELDTDSQSVKSFGLDSGCDSLTSVEELLDIQRDFRNEKIGDTKTRLHQLMDHIPEPSGKSLLLQTVALFETLLLKIQSMKKENETMTSENLRLTSCLKSKCTVEDDLKVTEGKLQSVNEELQETLQKLVTADRKFNEFKLEVEKKDNKHKQILDRQLTIEKDLKKEVDSLQSKLSSTQLGFKAESEMYQESLEKFSQQERCIIALEAKLSDLQQENSELSRQAEKRRESISSGEFPHHAKDPSVLSDSSFEHSTTKTTGSSSGVSSDLSDSDNDTSDPGQCSPSEEFINKEQFIESGIFEELQSTTQGTQTVGVDQQLSQLTEEIVKLTKFQTMVENSEPSSPVALEGGEDTESSATPGHISKVSEYGSCEELEMINGAERFDQREEVSSLTAKLREMEGRWETLYQQHQEVVEERCELEEAENDSRLRAQKLEMQYADSLDRLQMIKEELILERQNNYELKLQLEEFMNKDERNQEDIESLQLHLEEQESVIRELEDRAMYYNEELNLLNMGIKIASWWKTWSWLLINEEDPVLAQPDEDISNENLKKQEVKDLLEDQLKNVSSIRSEFEEREQGFANRIQSLQQEYDSFLTDMVSVLGGSNYANEVPQRKEEIIRKIKLLLHNELALKKQVTDLEKKETAYSKTIQEADSIMARVEYSYQERIKELEQEKHDLKEKIWSLENKTTKQKSLTDHKDEMKTISELVEKLDQVEKSELIMKEKIQSLEQFGEEMKTKLAEREVANAKIKHELRDQDELLTRITDMDNENKKMSQEIDRLKDVEQKMVELRETEELLRNRLRELEESEKALSISLGSDNQMKQKTAEASLQETCGATGGDEKITLRSHSVVCAVQDQQHSLKRQVNTLKLQIKDLETEVESKSAELESIECGYRSELYNLRQQLIKSNDELSDTNQHRSQLENEVFSLRKRDIFNSQEIENLKNREAQHLIQWNLLMAERESDISCLMDQRELDLLAESEDGLAELTRDISETSQQIKACRSCGDRVASKLEDISSQLASLTTILVGEEAEDDNSSHCSVLRQLAAETSDSEDQLDSYQSGLGHPCRLADSEDYREKSVMRELVEETCGEMECGQTQRTDSQGRASRLKDQQRWGTTSIMIERDSKQMITNIIRLDNGAQPAVIFSKAPEFATELHCEIQAVSEDHSDASSRISEENNWSVGRLSSLTSTKDLNDVKDVTTQTELPDLNWETDGSHGGAERDEELNDYMDRVEDLSRRMTRKDNELALAQKELMDVCKNLEEAKIKNDEQMAEICLLSRRVDQLQRSKVSEVGRVASGPSSFIIKDLQMQVQQLTEKNVKKDSLIKKLAETVIRTPEISIYVVVDNLQKSTVKPSDRRIDFDMETLCSFLEKRKTSLSDPSPAAPVSFTERIKTRL